MLQPQFKGPFGVWPFPILNYFMCFLIASQQRLGIYGLSKTLPGHPSSSKGFHNLEKFEIKYDKNTGDPIEIVVHRKVEPNESTG